MTVVQVISAYVASNMVLCVAFTMVLCCTKLLQFCERPFSHRTELKLHSAVILAVIMVSGIHPFLPEAESARPVATVWFAPSGKALAPANPPRIEDGYLSLTGPSSSEKAVSLKVIGTSVLVLAAVLFLLNLLKMASDLKKLFRIRSRAYLVRRIHRLHIWVSREIDVPFSFWIPGQMNVVIPESLVGTPNYRFVLLHEIQHHRQHDTQGVYLLLGLRFFYFINPVIAIWSRWIGELQEFACDEALVQRQSVNSLEYAECLVEVAQSVAIRGPRAACSMGLIFLFNKRTLKRRLEAMLEQNKKIGSQSSLTIGIAMVAVIGLSGFAAQGFIQDHRISRSRAQVMAKMVSSECEIPLVINDQVLKWLNYFMGTPDGRAELKEALVQMESYRNDIEGKLKEYHLPAELMAIPLIESGFRNLESNKNPVRAAGLWQFMAKTARNFGLTVNVEVDERLHVQRSSDAALRLLLSNKLRFNDWTLSILAYNAGEGAVQRAIEKTGSRDPWVLIRSAGFTQENTEYLPKFMAGVLAMKNVSAP